MEANQVQIDWRAEGEGIARAFEFYDLSEMELRVCLAIKRKSLDLARRVAVFPLLKHLSWLTDLREGHLTLVLRGLQKLQVLRVRGIVYGFCLPASKWRVRERGSIARIGEEFADWAELDGWLAGLDPAQPFEGRSPAALQEMFPEDDLEWALVQGVRGSPGTGVARDVIVDLS